jgi:hypothetical protein
MPSRATCIAEQNCLSSPTPIASGSLMDLPSLTITDRRTPRSSHTSDIPSPLSVVPNPPSTTMLSRPMPLPISRPTDHCGPRGIVLIKTDRISHGGLPSRHEFAGAMDAYLAALSSKKLPKALITQVLYEEIAYTLKREKNNLPGIGTPQFRFWCR